MKRLPMILVGFVLLAGLRAVEGGEQPDTPPCPRLVRIGHYQCVCHQGDFEANLATIIRGLQFASESRLDIVSFPESFLTGYFRREEDARANAFTIDSPQIQRVLEQTARFDLVFLVGFNELRGNE